MFSRCRATHPVTTLALGVVLGWSLATFHTPALRADRSGPGGEDLIAAGSVSIEHNPGLKVQVAHDALYYLDYKAGRLLAMVPSPRQSGSITRMIDGFSERDLVADFKLTPGLSAPHFLMTTGLLGAFSGGRANLYVFEATTRQMATYRLTPMLIGDSSRPRFELLEIRSIAPATPQPVVP